MRIDHLSEPEYNVFGSSITSMPLSSGPVPAFGHDSSAVGSTSSSSSTPVQVLVYDSSASVGSTTSASSSPVGSPFSFKSAPAVHTSVESEPVQSCPPTTFGYGGFTGVPSQTPALQATFGSSASATLTSSPVNSSSTFGFGCAPAVTSNSSEPTQALGPATYSFGRSAAPTPHQAPVQASFGSNASSPAHSSSPFGFSPAITSTQALGSTPFRFGGSVAATSSSFETMQAPVQATFGSNAPAHSSSSFRFSPAIASNGSGPTQAFGSTPFGWSRQSPTQATFGSGACSSSTSSSFLVSRGITPRSSLFGGCEWAKPDVAVSPASSSFTTTVVFGTTPVSVSSPFGPAPQNIPLSSSWGQSPTCFSSNIFGPNQSAANVFSQPPQHPLTSGVPKRTSLFGNSGVPAFGVDYTPGSPSNAFGPTPFSDSAYPFYAPTRNDQDNGTYVSISASNAYGHKSHEELRWEDYNKGVKGGFFPAARVSPIGSMPNAVFSPSIPSPSRFASPSVPDHLQKTNFGPTQENMTVPPFGFFPSGLDQRNPQFTGVQVPFTMTKNQRTHETNAVSSPASGCTSCGATSRSSASSGHFTFNGATTPPPPPSAAAASLPGLFFPTFGSVPMMFGTNLAAQVTTPALQAYPVQGYILLPFSAMSLQ